MDMTLTEDEAYKNFAEKLGVPIDEIKAHHNSDEEALAFFKQKALEKQIIKYIVEKNDVKIVKTEGADLEGE